MWKTFLIVICLQGSLAASSLRIVGSSTVFPFAATVAEHFHYKTNHPTPLIESTGTGAGLKLFCGSQNVTDGAMASRPITASEKKRCADNKITFQEFKIGQDGLVVFHKKGEDSITLSLQDLAIALKEKIPNGNICIVNPHKTWKDVRKNLPDIPIRVLGPAPTSGTYDVLMENIGGTCGPYLRHDGAYIEAPTNENLIIQKVMNATDTLGIVTYSFYERSRDKLTAITINGVMPELETIQKGAYPLSRDLYLYLKTNNLKENPLRSLFMLEFTSPSAIGENGYLNDKGLIPLDPNEQAKVHEMAKRLRTQ